MSYQILGFSTSPFTQNRIYSLLCDTAADLPASVDGYSVGQGWTAKVIEDGSSYIANAAGSWIQQPSSNQFSNVYTKAEIDSMFSLYYTKTEADALFVWKTITISGISTLDFISDGSPLDSWIIYGNMTQDVPPGECGDKTTNLFNYITQANGINGYYLNESGAELPGVTWTITDYIPCDGTSFTLNAVGGSNTSICLYDADKQFITGKRYATGGAANKTSITITSVQTAKYIRFSWYSNHDSVYDDPAALMLNSGSTALDFEPYGYKIPITCDTTQTIYLSEPLRKAIDGSGAVDVMSSDGTITRNVDSDGNELTPPTTETFDAPTITPDPGENTLTVDTTTPPSAISITGKIRNT